jgi:predicted signal transduction protein with EAL and GGDEF domain
LIALAAGRNAEAATSFERAIYLDPDGALTDAIAFRAAGPRAQLVLLYGKTGRDLAAIRLAEAEQQNPQSLISSALRRALSSGTEQKTSPTTFSFDPSLEVARSRASGIRTLAQMNEAAASGIRDQLLASLVESSARLGQYDRAIAIERLRALEATKADEKAAIEKRLAEIAAAERARQLRLALVTRIDKANAATSIYATRVLGKE